MSDSTMRGCRSDTCFGERNGDDKYCVECRHVINELTPKSPKVTESPLKDQVGSVIKYVTRWRDKGGIKDLEKAKHFIELLIELENDNVGKAN